MLDGPKVITLRIEENDHKSDEYSRVTMVMGIGVLQGVVGDRIINSAGKGKHFMKRTRSGHRQEKL